MSERGHVDAKVPWPANSSPAEVGYAIGTKATKWFCPSQLARTAVRAGIAAVFGGYSDRRETMAVFEADVIDESGRDDIWIDYIADTGDGWAEAMSVFHAVSAPTLAVRADTHETCDTERGQLLVLGGDQIYPTASADRYEHQLVGPLRSSWAWTEDQPPTLLAVPGNHDWYDGLTSFLRVFCQQRWIGARRTRQTRSYFAVKLAHNWWLWGIDVQLGGYVDRSQVEWFTDVASRLAPGASIILAVAEPQWVKASEPGEADHYSTLDYFLRKTLGRTDAQVRIALSGDLHHYSRYGSDNGVQLFTAGIGGAFLHGTARLPERITIPPPEASDPAKSDPVDYVRHAAYPDARSSRRIATTVARLPFVNGGLPALVGGLYLVMAAILGMTGDHPPTSGLDVASRFGRNPAMWVIGAGLVVGLTKFTKSKGMRAWCIGAAHSGTHFVVGLLVAALAAEVVGERLVGDPADVTVGLLATAVIVGGVGALAGCWVLALWLWISWRFFGLNNNELFAALRHSGHKGFLRLHLTPAGDVEVFPIVIDRVCPRRKWRLRAAPANGGYDEPWFEPGEPLAPHLAEPPVVIGPNPARAPVTADLRDASTRATPAEEEITR